jgi:hypothetical protein
VVEERPHGSVRGEPDGPGHDRRWGGDGLLVVTALDGVLELELRLRRQHAEVDPRSPPQHAVRDVLLRVGTAELIPAGVVRLAEQAPVVLDPDRAERQLALASAVS